MARQVTPALVSTAWLAGRLGASASQPAKRIRLLDANSYAAPTDVAFAAAPRIPGARHFNVAECSDRTSGLSSTLPSAAHFAEYAGHHLGICKDSHVVLYDNCMYAPRVWWMFRVFGHEDVSVLDGGLAAWVAEGRSVKTGPLATSFPPVDFHANEINKNTLYRSFEEFCQALRSASVQVADARSAKRFHGVDPEPRVQLPRGHAMGAANVFFRSLYDATTGRMLPAERLRRLFFASGVDPSKPLVATCGSGITACHLALAAHTLGNTEVAVYDGSWEEFAVSGPAELRALLAPGKSREE